MKKCFVVLFLIFSIFHFSQSLDNQTFKMDLDFVYKHLIETTSFKTQKKNNLKQKYLDLKKEFGKKNISIIESYIIFYQLVDEIKDLHNDIYGNTESFEYEELLKPEFLQKIKNSPDYNVFPKVKMNLDSLENNLKTRDFSSPEGIYFYNKYFKIGIFKNSKQILQGVVLETKIPSWERGETMLYLLPKNDNIYRLISGKFIDKQLFSTLDYFSEGEFKLLPWKKNWDKNTFYNADFPKEKFVFKNLNNDTDYLKLGSFNSSNSGIKEATDFYNKIANHINSKNIILDLRNNSGGGERSSNQFYKLLKKYKGKIYVLMNFKTVSNTEQFIVKLKNSKKIILLGDRTRGMITYGRNYNEDFETPSGKFRIYFSDMKDNWRDYLPYEEKGIQPEIKLKSDKSWIEQTTEIIQNKKNSLD